MNEQQIALKNFYDMVKKDVSEGVPIEKSLQYNKGSLKRELEKYNLYTSPGEFGQFWNSIKKLVRDNFKKDVNLEKPDDNSLEVMKNKLISSGVEELQKLKKSGELDENKFFAEMFQKFTRNNFTEEDASKYTKEIFNIVDPDSLIVVEDESRALYEPEKTKFLELPMLNIDYDNMQNLKTVETLDPISSDTQTPLLSDAEEKLGNLNTEYRDLEEKNSFESDLEVNRLEDPRRMLMKEGELVGETQYLEDFIRQKKVCMIYGPFGATKKYLEDIYVGRYLDNLRENRFNSIYIFTWEDSPNKAVYKSYDQILEYNRTLQGSLFVVRDIKTFNVYASELIQFPLRNYFLVLLDGLVTREDLEVLDSKAAFLYTETLDMKQNLDIREEYSLLTGKNKENYIKVMTEEFSKPSLGISESIFPTVFGNENPLDANTITAARRALTVDYTGISNFNICSLEASLRRSPKFGSILSQLFSYSEKRILLKVQPGQSGIDPFEHVYSLYQQKGKQPFKIFFIRRSDSDQIRLGKLKDIPDNGPVLVVTDAVLTEIVPVNIDMFFISGGGEYLDLQTILFLLHFDNWKKPLPGSSNPNRYGNYPRNFIIYFFISKIDGETGKTIDEVDFQNTTKYLSKMIENQKKYKSHAKTVTFEGDKLIVSM